jgi:hypothetical protein
VLGATKHEVLKKMGKSCSFRIFVTGTDVRVDGGFLSQTL